MAPSWGVGGPTPGGAGTSDRPASFPAPTEDACTDEQILRLNRQWVDREGTLNGVAYRAASSAHGWPSMAIVAARFGSWVRALQAVGVAVDAAHGGRPKLWTNDQLTKVVAEYFAQADKWSLQGLGLWLKAREGGPSLSLVRKRLGPWPALTKMATMVPG